MFEVWDRVTGNLLGEYATREEAEEAIAFSVIGPWRDDFVILDPEDEE